MTQSARDGGISGVQREDAGFLGGAGTGALGMRRGFERGSVGRGEGLLVPEAGGAGRHVGVEALGGELAEGGLADLLGPRRPAPQQGEGALHLGLAPAGGMLLPCIEALGVDAESLDLRAGIAQPQTQIVT